MSAPLIPSPLDYIGRRRFAFYPPVRNAEPNEWMLGLGSWAEVQVVNAQTGSKIWMSRQYIGGVTDSSTSNLLIVGLTQDLELREGVIEPRTRRVIEMPRPAGYRHRPKFAAEQKAEGPALVIGIRLEQNLQSPLKRPYFRLGILALVMAGLAALIAAASRI